MSKSRNVLRGYAHEFLVAEKIIEQNNAYASFSTSESQQNLYNIRLSYVHELRNNFPQEYAKIMLLAEKSASLLPLAYSTVDFVETSANGSDVYDVIYSDIDENLIKVSCKLAKMEDKAYRFSTENYVFNKEMVLLQSLFTEEDTIQGLSFQESLNNKGYSVRKLQYELVNSLKYSLINQSDQSYDMFMKLLSERFIGYGGFYKTLPNGEILYYPEQVIGEDSLLINVESVDSTHTTLLCEADLLDKNFSLKQKYLVSFRVKFKDGVNKPVRLNSHGYPTNISATVKTVLM